MKFKEWVDSERGTGESRTNFLRAFSKKCKVSVQTLQFVMKDGKLSFYHKAKAISKATKGKVSVEELCE